MSLPLHFRRWHWITQPLMNAGAKVGHNMRINAGSAVQRHDNTAEQQWRQNISVVLKAGVIELVGHVQAVAAGALCVCVGATMLKPRAVFSRLCLVCLIKWPLNDSWLKNSIFLEFCVWNESAVRMCFYSSSTFPFIQNLSGNFILVLTVWIISCHVDWTHSS